MELKDLPDWAKSALASYEALRRVGFSSDEIFFQFIQTNDDPKTYFVVAIQRPPGTVIFFIPIDDLANIGGSQKVVADIFTDAITAWNDPKKKEECTSIWKEQMPEMAFLGICMDLEKRGLVNISELAAKARAV
jgi:hypothetical protein